uniref:SUEL-type lectin domain-containing protein n=1 Tax=Globodera pallida TaxID=36090 RepID=A0A183CHF1_GLOPA
MFCARLIRLFSFRRSAKSLRLALRDDGMARGGEGILDLSALLAESLRLKHVKACEGERVTLHCPRNTHISLQTIFYGRLVPSQELCPSTNDGGRAQQTVHASSSRARPSVEDTSCDFAEAHSRVQELCRSKKKCRLLVRPEFFGDRDPCPGTSKYLQIGYKCSPIKFEDQNFCEGQQTQLGCKPGRRLSIYSANYGRTTNGQAMHCSTTERQQNDDEQQKNGETDDDDGEEEKLVREDCVSDVLPQLARRCHAQPSCSLPVDDRFLGSPCPVGVSKYLSVIFVCVNEEVFSEAALRGRLEKMAELEKVIFCRAEMCPTAHLGTEQTPPPQPFCPTASKPCDSVLTTLPSSADAKASGERRRSGKAKRRTGKVWTTALKRRRRKQKGGREGAEERRKGDPKRASSEANKSFWQKLLNHLNAEGTDHTLFVGLLLLSLVVILALSLCVLILCQHRLRERAKRRKERQNRRRTLDQEFERQNSVFAASGGKRAGKEKGPRGAKCELGFLLSAAESSNASPVYVDSSDGSNHRLLDAAAFAPPLPPPLTSADIYHECYLPCGSFSSGGGGYYGRFDEQQQRMGTAQSGQSSARKVSSTQLINGKCPAVTRWGMNNLSDQSLGMLDRSLTKDLFR